MTWQDHRSPYAIIKGKPRQWAWVLSGAFSPVNPTVNKKITQIFHSLQTKSQKSLSLYATTRHCDLQSLCFGLKSLVRSEPIVHIYTITPPNYNSTIILFFFLFFFQSHMSFWKAIIIWTGIWQYLFCFL